MSKDFRRQHFWKHKKLGKTLKWRKPRGHKNAMRQRGRGRLPMPSTGYRTPAAKRHLHPTGLIETRIFNVDGLNGLDSKYIVRIASTVGRRKRRTIFKKARELGLRMVQSEPKAQPKVQPKVQPKAKPKVETKTKPKVEVKTKPKVEAKAKPKTQAKPKTATKVKVKTETKPKTKAKPVQKKVKTAAKKEGVKL
ncbi:MAG: hypothetical protein GOV00_01085 [Candidatus Altiarchaeota archaeon]|nr:hypothetical protein [Candidatus Altiarchaeota archaeon]